MQYTVALFSGKPLDISSTLLNVLGTPHPTPTHPGHPVVGYYIYVFFVSPKCAPCFDNNAICEVRLSHDP